MGTFMYLGKAIKEASKISAFGVREWKHLP